MSEMPLPPATMVLMPLRAPRLWVAAPTMMRAALDTLQPMLLTCVFWLSCYAMTAAVYQWRFMTCPASFRILPDGRLELVESNG